MMDLISDDDGVQVILGKGGPAFNIDFNFGRVKLKELSDQKRKWDVNLYDGETIIGRATFNAHQFMADGVERRTIALLHMEVKPEFRGQGMSYNVMQFIIDTVTAECDSSWGAVSGKPVLFIEKRDSKKLLDQGNLFDFLRKIGKRVLGVNQTMQSIFDQDISVTVMGDDISMQLIEGHLLRSSPKS
jgi:GNAT superfamily N-acetyltransferase